MLLSAGRQVVNLQEARAMEAATVNFFAVNCAVGIALARVPGFSAKVAQGILGALPFAASSLVGVRSEAEAVQARMPTSAARVPVTKGSIAQCVHGSSMR